MIDNKSLDNTFGLAEKLATSGVTLDLVDTSALQHIVADMHLLPQSDEISIDDWRDSLQGAARNDDHDGSMGIIADNAANSVLNTHRLVVDVINPQVRNLVEAISNKLNNNSGATAPAGVTVNYLSMNPALELPTFREAIERIASMDVYDHKNVSVGHYTLEEILDLIKFSSVDDFDTVLSSWLTENPEEVERINSVLDGSRPAISDIDPLCINTKVVLVLLSQSLIHTETIKEGLNISISEYKNKLFSLSTLVARDLLDYIKKWDHLINTKYIYKPGDNEDNNITLIQPVVLDLFSKGVAVEHLIGNHLLNRPYKYIDFISEDEEVRVKVINNSMSEFNRVSKLINDKVSSEKSDNLIRVALTTIRDEAIELTEDPEVLSRLGDTKETLVARANAACDNIYKSGKKFNIDKLGEFVAGTVISIYYAHTDALIYMDSLAKFSDKYPEMNVIDLAKLARANLVVNWVCQQLAISK